MVPNPNEGGIFFNGNTVRSILVRHVIKMRQPLKDRGVILADALVFCRDAKARATSEDFWNAAELPKERIFELTSNIYARSYAHQASKTTTIGFK